MARASASTEIRALILPRWVAIADQVIAAAARSVARGARGSPANFGAELERITRAWTAGERASPSFVYGSLEERGEYLRALEELARVARAEGELGAVYADRAEELLLEAHIARAIGTRDLLPLVRTRYAGLDRFDADADDVAMQWVGGASGRLPSAERSEGSLLRRTCDARDEGSLVSLLRAEIGRRKLPVRVMVKPGLSPLAATGPGVVFVAAERFIDDRAAERTVLHEIEGHVLPELASARTKLGIFRASTKGGSDDQEGYALTIENRRGFLDEGRKAELGLRHLAARALHEGATFVEASELLLSTGADVRDAVRIAMRAHRGGSHGAGGLGRERVYIGAFLRVRDAVLRDASLERAIERGRVSVAAARVLLPFVDA